MVSSQARVYDIAVVGLGPAGLRALSYGGMLGLSMLGLDELNYAGGKIPMLYGWKPIKDVGIHPPPTGNDFVNMLLDDAQQYHKVVMKTREEVLDLRRQEERFSLTTEHDTYFAKAVIIAGGTGSIKLNYFPQREFLFYLGNGLFYYQIRPQDCAGKRILIVGGGASAVEMAPYVAKYADHVTLIHRRNEFRKDALPFVEDLTHPKISVLMPYELSEIHGSHRVSGATLRNTESGQERQMRIESIVACLGYKENLGLITKWGFGEGGMRGRLLKVDEKFQTTQAGVFAVGECAVPPWYRSRIPLIQTWLSEAVHAVSQAYAYAYGKKAFQGYSTLMDGRKKIK